MKTRKIAKLLLKSYLNSTLRCFPLCLKTGNSSAAYQRRKRKKKDYFSVSGRTDKMTAAGCLLLKTTLYRAKTDLPTES